MMRSKGEMRNTSVVEKLYELCKETFSPDGVVPPEPAIIRLKYFLDTMKPTDVGLDEAQMLRAENEESYSYMDPGKRRRPTKTSGVVPRRKWPPPVRYVHIHECDTFSIGIFCLPRSAIIPLHNHPGMTVLSKVLYGSMHVTAYDWYNHLSMTTATQHPHLSRKFPGMRLAKLKVDSVLTASNESNVLYPTRGGNIHSFTALTSCAVLDVLSPPYEEDPSYYRLGLLSGLLRQRKEDKENGHDGGCAWLEEVDKPDNFTVSGQAYMGPTIEVI